MATLKIAEGKDCIMVMRYEAGKSLIYQMLPIVKPGGCVLVMCPLIALMTDQVSMIIGIIDSEYLCV